MAISFVTGTVFLLADIIQRKIRKKEIKFLLDANLKFFSWALLAVIVSQLIVYFIHDGEVDWLNRIWSAYKNYFQWIWIIYLFQNLNFEKEFGKDCKYDFKNMLMLAVVFASFISALYISLQFAGLAALNSKGHLGIISQPFTSSGVSLAGIFASIYVYRKKLLNNYFAIAIIFLQVIGLLLLGQVSVWFGLLFGFLVINFKQRIVSFRILGLIIVVAVSVLFLATEYVPKINRKLSWFNSVEKLTTNKSISCRYGLWQENLQELKTNWLFGNKRITKYACTIKDKTNLLGHAHNIYLHQLFTGGVFRLLIWLVFYFGLLYYLVKTYSENQAFIGLFAALSLEGFFEYWWGDSEVKNIFLIVMFCAVIARRHLIVAKVDLG